MIHLCWILATIDPHSFVLFPCFFFSNNDILAFRVILYWFLNPRHSCSRAKLRAGAPLYGSAHVSSPNSSSSAASSTATPARSSSSLCSSCPPSVSASSPPSSTRALSSSGSRVSHLTVLCIFLLKHLSFNCVCLSFQLLASSLCFILKQLRNSISESDLSHHKVSFNQTTVV